jgi:CheY-like chemotaxis protein
MVKIMVVDDEPDNIELMHIILTKHSFEPILFTNPVKALDALKSGTWPDLLILDMRMPEMSGIDFCNELRKDTRFDTLKIAFFTASTDLDMDLLRRHKVLGFIYKPFNINELVEQINKYLNT